MSPPARHRWTRKCSRRSRKMVRGSFSSNARDHRDRVRSGRMIRSSPFRRGCDRNISPYDHGCSCRDHGCSCIPSLPNWTHHPMSDSTWTRILDELSRIPRSRHGSMGRDLSNPCPNMDRLSRYLLEDHGICRAPQGSSHGNMGGNSTDYHGIPPNYRRDFHIHFPKYHPIRRRSFRGTQGNI